MVHFVLWMCVVVGRVVSWDVCPEFVNAKSRVCFVFPTCDACVSLYVIVVIVIYSRRKRKKHKMILSVAASRENNQ